MSRNEQPRTPPPNRGDKPPRRFPCPECPEWFWFREDLSRHRNAIHPAQAAAPEQDEAVRLRAALIEAIDRNPPRGAFHYTAGYVDALLASIPEAATPPPEQDEAVRLHKYLHDEGVWPDEDEAWHQRVCEGALATPPPVPATPIDLDAVWDHVRVEHGCTHDVFRFATPPPDAIEYEEHSNYDDQTPSTSSDTRS